MNPDHLVPGHGKHVEGIGAPQVVLFGEGELGQLGKVVEIIGMDPGIVEGRPVVAGTFYVGWVVVSVIVAWLVLGA